MTRPKAGGKTFLAILLLLFMVCYSAMDWVGSIIGHSEKMHIDDTYTYHDPYMHDGDGIDESYLSEISHGISSNFVDPIPLPGDGETMLQNHSYQKMNETINDVTDVPLFDNKDNVSVSIVVVASHQRSSSTYLSDEILGKLPCHLPLNEIFTPTPSQSGDAWPTVGKELGIKEVNWDTSNNETRIPQPTLLATFVLEVARRQCRQKLRQEGDAAKGCHNHCWVNYKHFPIHTPNSELVWDALIDQNHFHHNPTSSFAMVILERNVQDRFRSYWFANHTGDWNVQGSKEHKEKLANMTVPNDTEEAISFQNEHQWWFKKVRDYANQTLHPLGVPVFELSFNDITNRSTINGTQKELQGKLLSSYIPEYRILG